MTKIKNFRILIRHREVARLLKAQQNNIPLDPAQEASLEAALVETRPLIAPAALYATLTRQTTVHAVPFELPKKAVAFSALCATIGPELSALRQAADTNGLTARVQLLSAIEQEARQQAVAFALRLIQDQAKKEDCVLTDAQDCQEPQSRQKLATLLDLERIGLTLAAPESLLPDFARLLHVVWMPAGKPVHSKKNKSRPEKVVL